MKKLERSLRDLNKAIKKGQPVACNRWGYWYVERPFMVALRRFFRQEESRKLGLIQALVSLLEETEKTPVRFRKDDQISLPQFFHEPQALLTAADSVVASDINNSAVRELQRHALALRYRLEGVHGGVDKVPADANMLSKIRSAVINWKESHEVLTEIDLSAEEEKKLIQTCEYAEFANMLMSDESLMNQFFSWIIQDKNSVSVFVEFPKVQQRIVDCLLNGRVSRFGKEILRVTFQECDADTSEKVVVLPFEGKDLSILGEEREIVFRGNYRMTIRDVFHFFRDKYIEVGNLELMAEGIINWNVFEWGFWNADKNDFDRVDLEHSGWWKDLPVFEILSKKDAQERYGDHLDGFQWNVTAVSTRGTLTMDFENSHAFEEIAVPLGDGSYRVYSFGKYATEFPVTFYEKVTSLAKTVPATVSYPDENEYYTFRQHARHYFGSCQRSVHAETSPGVYSLNPEVSRVYKRSIPLSSNASFLSNTKWKS